MKAKEIANTNWRNKDASKAIVDLVEAVLDGLMPNESIGTTRLVDHLLPGCDDKEARALFSHLYNARANGSLDGYFTMGKPNGGTFGKPSIKWHAPVATPAMSDRERLEIIKRDNPELYAEIYGKK